MSVRPRLRARYLPHRTPLVFRLVAALAFLVVLSPSLHAQTIEDGIMLSRQKLCTGVFYTYDYWDHYWEGSLNRTNGNLGTVTTRTAQWTGNYAVDNRLNVIAITPYVWTSASQGVLHCPARLPGLHPRRQIQAPQHPRQNASAPSAPSPSSPAASR